MEDMKITAKIETVGFRPSEIRPRKMWTVLQDNLLELYNDYCEVSNPRIAELNKDWNEKHPDDEEDKEDLTDSERALLDVKDRLDSLLYGCFMRSALDECAFTVNEKHPDSYLSGFVTQDLDGNPAFAARIKQHPELTMHFVIESK